MEEVKVPYLRGKFLYLLIEAGGKPVPFVFCLVDCTCSTAVSYHIHALTLYYCGPEKPIIIGLRMY